MEKYALRRIALRLRSRISRSMQHHRAEVSPNVLFIWIPKTAGTSIYNMLQQAGMGKYKSIDQAKYRFPGSGMATFVHQSIPALVEAGAVNGDFVRSAFKFSFSRNPYDRAVSLYHYFRRYQRIPDEMKFDAFVNILDSEWELHRDLPRPEVASLSSRVRYRGESVSQESHVLYPPGAYNVLEWSQCRPQTDWLSGLGGIGEIRIGRMENIDEDFKAICDEIIALHGTSGRNVSHLATTSLPKHNVTPHGHFMEHFKEPSLRKIIERVYQSDFEQLGY